MKYSIDQIVEIPIHRRESNFDRACEEAWSRAVSKFGIDDCGHFTAVEGAKRSNSWVEVNFVSLKFTIGMSGADYHYEFTACVRQNKENDD